LPVVFRYTGKELYFRLRLFVLTFFSIYQKSDEIAVAFFVFL